MAVQIQTLLASAARTASGSSRHCGGVAAEYVEGNIYLDVTAQSGTTPTLDVAVQSSHDGATFHTHSSFTQVAAATGKQLLKLTSLGSYVRIDYTIAGTTPSYTFSVTAEFKRHT